MNKIILILIGLLISTHLFAQEKMYIHKTDKCTIGAPVTATDSIYFNSDKTMIYFQIADSLMEYPIGKIDSLSFGPNSDTIYINYWDNWVNVINPLAFEGVTVSVNNAQVVISNKSELRDIFYSIKGSTSNGSLKIYSEKRFNLIMNGINITNQEGPAINNQSNNKMTVFLNEGTNNTLSDGTNYSDAPIDNDGNEEDQKAAFFSEGEIDILGSGKLIIKANGIDKHALASDEDTKIESGNLLVSTSQKDGIHGKEGFSMVRGSLEINSKDDGIDADEGYIEILGGIITIKCTNDDIAAMKCDSSLTISGGSVNITIDGDQSKGLKSGMDMLLSAGNITINTLGGVVLNSEDNGFDPSYCSAIRSEANLEIIDAEISISSTGKAGKGLSIDKDFTMASGKLSINTSGNGDTYLNSKGETDVYQSTCISVDGTININGGMINISTSGSGGRGISGDATLIISGSGISPIIDIKTSGVNINISETDDSDAKAIKIDGSVIIDNCEISVESTGDAFNSNESISINGGDIIITKCYEGMESPSINLNGGNLSIESATNDGIHTTANFTQNNGELSIIANGDGIDGDDGSIEISGGILTVICSSADVKGLKCGGNLTISGGNLNFTITGNQSKAIKCDSQLSLSGGSIVINTSGGVVLESSGSGFDPSYCTAIKGEGNILINGSDVNITMTGVAAKGVSGDKEINMTSGNLKITSSGTGSTYKNTSGVTDAYFSTCITCTGSINIIGGSLTTSSSGSGGRGISGDATLTIGGSGNSPIIDIATSGASITLSSGGGHGGGTVEAAEAKAIKCDGAVTINNAQITISSADDGIKTPTSITINNGTVSITKSYEGMESPAITVNAGNLSVISTDDAINGTKGNGGEADGNSQVNINAGYVMLNSSKGDPMDSNGDFTLKGGTVIVHGPQSSPEVGMDVNGTSLVSGGFLVISGTNSNMTEAPSTSSTQYSVLIKSQQSISSSSIFHIQDESGNDILSFKPVRNCYSIIFSSPDLKAGTTYYIFTGGTHTGTFKDGVYSGGTYSNGTQKKSFTLNNKVTNITI